MSGFDTAALLFVRRLFGKYSMTQMPSTADLSRDITPSEDRVLGKPPRISPLDVGELDGKLIEIVLRMIKVNQAVDAREPELLVDLLAIDGGNEIPAEALSGLLAKIPEIVRTMLRHPDLFARQVDIGIQLLAQGSLEPRDRELCILRIGWLCQAPYQWGEHVIIARKNGLDQNDIERIIVGADAPGWNDRERALLRATEELHQGAMITDATWEILARYLNAQQLIELPVVVGQYQTVAYYQNSLRLRLHDGNLGLRAR